MHMIVVGSDAENPTWLEGHLAQAGFTALRFASPQDALAHPATPQAVAGVIESGRSAFGHDAIVARLRDRGFGQPLMVLTAHSDWRERVRTLDAGADDYLLKPLRSEELIARVRAVIRRGTGTRGTRIETGPFVCDLSARRIWLDDVPLDLTRNEFRLLRIFLLRPERTLSHGELHSLLYPGDTPRTGNAIEVHIARLRRKIGDRRIATVRGVGYRLNASADA
ncbi:MAG: response regulator transcription factor [Sphingomonadales bacterium]|nr:response regulator transcription factor [Sphingomonadales bacterium]